MRPWVDLHEHPGFLRVWVDYNNTGPQQLLVFGDFRLKRLRNCLPLGQYPVVQFKGLCENELDPPLMRSGVSFTPFKGLLPIIILLPQQPKMVRVVGFQSGIECFQ